MEILQVTHVDKSYGEKAGRVQALRDVSLSVQQGAFVAIVLVKQLFGGIGMNFANPALAGRVRGHRRDLGLW